ncbi:FAD-dependent oxidoreductase [Sandarakinorhabdus sp.]|uniref:FAD-dependent oxidoreductase n=1 Tax=Sandarakinorhabdus sp. TaxID=1916663 RepID=UPI003F71B350
MITTRRHLIAGIGGIGLAGCTTAAPRHSGFAAPPLVPLRLELTQLTHITVCLRPFRAAGPRIEVESIGDKRVVHHYGHGGSGWSLSWGSAAVAAPLALADGRRDIAVIGCGAIGLTTAITLQRAGARVTIYAAERLPQSRSARATGTWSPDSRIAAVDKVAPGFPAAWEAMARHSYNMHRTFVGLPGDPVAWSDRYTLLDAVGPRPPRAEGAIHFAEYGGMLNDLVPRGRALRAGEHPFPVANVRRSTSMQFNVAALGQQMMADFLREGGRIETATFNTPADFARLSQSVIVNCTGYGARALMNDNSIVPVRGQISWLAPQPGVNYGVYYRSVSVLPRPDGMVVQYVGDSDMYGVGNDSEEPDRGETERAIATVAAIFSR